MRAKFTGTQTGWITPGREYKVEAYSFGLRYPASLLIIDPQERKKKIVPYESLDAMFDNWEFERRRK